MNGAWPVLALVAAGCVGRAWNHDETERISEVMARDTVFDTSAAIPMHDMPRLAAPTYGPPVFVRDAEDKRRTRVRPRSAPRAPPSALDDAREKAAKGERERAKATRERKHGASGGERR